MKSEAKPHILPIIWDRKDPSATLDDIGMISMMLSRYSTLRARDQLDHNYTYGSGWRPIAGFTMAPDGTLSYPEDPPLRVLYETTLRDETIRIYRYAWVSITQLDGSFEVARMD